MKRDRSEYLAVCKNLIQLDKLNMEWPRNEEKFSAIKGEIIAKLPKLTDKEYDQINFLSKDLLK